MKFAAFYAKDMQVVEASDPNAARTHAARIMGAKDFRDVQLYKVEKIDFTFVDYSPENLAHAGV